MSTRLVKLPLSMITLLPDGQPLEQPANLHDMLIRLKIEPEWIQHQYYFVKLK